MKQESVWFTTRIRNTKRWEERWCWPQEMIIMLIEVEQFDPRWSDATDVHTPSSSLYSVATIILALSTSLSLSVKLYLVLFCTLQSVLDWEEQYYHYHKNIMIQYHINIDWKYSLQSTVLTTHPVIESCTISYHCRQSQVDMILNFVVSFDLILCRQATIRTFALTASKQCRLVIWMVDYHVSNLNA